MQGLLCYAGMDIWFAAWSLIFRKILMKYAESVDNIKRGTFHQMSIAIEPCSQKDERNYSKSRGRGRGEVQIIGRCPRREL